MNDRPVTGLTAVTGVLPPRMDERTLCPPNLTSQTADFFGLFGREISSAPFACPYSGRASSLISL
jgi:hypothetical protein